MSSKFKNIISMVKVNKLFPWYIDQAFELVADNLYRLQYKGAILEIKLQDESILVTYRDGKADDYAENKLSFSSSTVETVSQIETFFKRYLSAYLFERLIPFGYFGFMIKKISYVDGEILIQISAKDNFGDFFNCDVIKANPNSQEGQIARLILESQGGSESFGFNFTQATIENPVHTLDHELGLKAALQGVLFYLVSNQNLQMERV
jgi:hypothetical protein